MRAQIGRNGEIELYPVNVTDQFAVRTVLPELSKEDRNQRSLYLRVTFPGPTNMDGDERHEYYAGSIERIEQGDESDA